LSHDFKKEGAIQGRSQTQFQDEATPGDIEV